ncbi:MAG: hypothetical protein FVQ83_02420 [Chloroflexi bacterium]|nr:hypothetical protein [Chloroflexota bacterium]
MLNQDRKKNTIKFVTWILLQIILLSACAPPRIQQGQIDVDIVIGGQTFSVTIPAGSTARDAVIAAGGEIDLLDRSEPELFTVLVDGGSVLFIHVVEEFVIEEVVKEFVTLEIDNETMPESEQRLVQSGVNGLKEITYRRVFEDNVEISYTEIRSETRIEPRPEIIMRGQQSPFTPQDIPGRLAYIHANNAWVMDGNTGLRKPVVTTGDLDSRVFSLSPGGMWLLYTRDDPDDDVINNLWITRVDGEEELTIDLETENVVHFASWIPGSNNGIAYSTMEVTTNAPGWEANNDLQFIYFSENGWVGGRETIIEGSSGGVYGWWGTNFVWSPDGEQLAYARPDGVGLVNFETETFSPIIDITPVQTSSAWAWIPGLSWSPGGEFLFIVDHVPQEGLISPEESTLFDVTGVSLVGGGAVSLFQQVGMDASPIPSPAIESSSGEMYYEVAFLRELSLTQTRISGYELIMMDRDGSNSRVVYPPEGSPGLNPSRFAWAPDILEGETGLLLAFIYQDNLWLANSSSGEVQPLTDDDILITALDWK